MDVAGLQDLIARALAAGGTLEAPAGGRVLRIEAGAVARPAIAGDMLAAAGPAVVLPAGAIVAPCYGIVHLTPSPGAPPFVRVGDTVAAGQRVCLVEAMKVFHPVTAPVAGRVAEILAEAGVEVARGAALLRVDAAAGGG